MRYNNSVIQHHHHALFAPLTWLERLEEQQHNGADRYPPTGPLPAPLNSTFIGLKTALLALQHGFSVEQRQLFSLLDNAGKASQLEQLGPHQQRITTSAQQLLDTLARIQSLANGEPSHLDRYSHSEDCWDQTAALITALSEQLIRYLHLAETSYLPMADYLLSRPGQQHSYSRRTPQPYLLTPSAHALAQHQAH